MNNRDKRWRNAFLTAGLLVLLFLGVTPVIAVVRVGAGKLASLWLVTTIQVTVAVLSVVLAVSVSMFVVQRLAIKGIRQLVKQLDDLRSNHDELVRKLALRTSPVVATMLLIAQAVLYFADKSFEEDKVTTVVLSLALIVLFWIANELAVSETRPRRRIGVALWIFSVLLLPGMIMHYHIGGIQAIWREFQRLNPATKIIVVIAFVGAFAAPYALSEKRSTKSLSDGPRTGSTAG